jgi:hypothetical protein
MGARDQHAQGGVLAVVHLGQGIRLGAGVQQKLGDLDRIGRRPLAAVLDAVAGQVVEQGGAMRERRSLAGEARVLSHQPPQRVQVATDDRLDGRLEASQARRRPSEPRVHDQAFQVGLSDALQADQDGRVAIEVGCSEVDLGVGGDQGVFHADVLHPGGQDRSVGRGRPERQQVRFAQRALPGKQLVAHQPAA